MKFDLARFLNGTDQVYHIEGKEESDIGNLKSDLFEIVGPIDYKGDVFKVDGCNLIQLDIFFKYISKCDRCLQPTALDIKSSLSGRLVESDKNSYRDDIEDESYDMEDEEIIYYDKDIFDPKEYILSQVIASLPMKILCGNNCKGICLNCGVDLNRESCDCVIDSIDPRFEKLKNLFPKK